MSTEYVEVSAPLVVTDVKEETHYINENQAVKPSMVHAQPVVAEDSIEPASDDAVNNPFNSPKTVCV